MRSISTMRPLESLSNDTEGTFSYSPLTPGYGVTIGNSMRRILLSSVPGAGITSISIFGIKQKFSSIDGMKEDVIHFIQNLKQVRFRFPLGMVDKIKLKLELAGPIVVTSSMILHSQDVVSILNDVYLCTLNDGCTLKCDIFVQKGSGYVDSTRSSEQMSPGSILIDNVLNAVRNVSFEVENTRYGEYTDYETLKLHVKTDGSITPTEALETASSILLDHFSVFSGNDGSKSAYNSNQDSGSINLSKLVKDIGLSDKTVAALHQFSIVTVGDLVKCTESYLLSIPRFGVRKIEDIKYSLSLLGLSLKDAIIVKEDN